MRDFLDKIKVSEVDKEADPYLEIPRHLAMEENAVIYRKPKDSTYPLLGNTCNSRDKFALALGVEKDDLIYKINNAIDNPSKPKIVKKGACQEVVEEDVNLSALPIPTHTSSDMGPYITSGVFIASDPEYGQNMSFHRATGMCPCPGLKTAARRIFMPLV